MTLNLSSLVFFQVGRNIRGVISKYMQNSALTPHYNRIDQCHISVCCKLDDSLFVMNDVSSTAKERRIPFAFESSFN